MSIRYTTARLKKSAAVLLTLSSTLGAMAWTTPLAFASTTAIDTLASQIASLGAKAHDGGTAASLAAPILTTMGQFTLQDWNEVLFGTTTLSTSQQKTTTALAGDIQQIATFSVTTQTAATALINDVIAKMQLLDSAIQSADVVSFLENMEQQTPSEILTILSLQGQSAPAGLTPAQLASAMHTYFAGSLGTASAPIQAIFSAAGPPSSTGGATGGAGGGSGSSTGASGAGAGGTSILTDVLKQVTVGAAGTTVTSSSGSTTVQLVVPANAFSQDEQISVSTGSVTSLPPGAPQGEQPEFAFGVSFTGAVPSQPITLTLTNPAIGSDMQVYKVTANGWVAVPATVTAGQAVISFTSDPDFVLVSATNSAGQGTGNGTGTGTGTGSTGTSQPSHLSPNQKVISLGGKPVVVPGQVRNGTTYMPIWYVMNMLNSMHITSHWDGVNWGLTAPTTLPADLSNLQLGVGRLRIVLNNTPVLNLTGFSAIDPTSHQLTTYMPIYDVMLVLNRLHIHSTWDGTTWGLQTQ